MNIVRLGVWVFVLAAGSTGCSDDDAGPICSAEALTAALAGASPGDTVRIGGCRIEGSFTVPAGVTLAGRGIGTTTVAWSGTDTPALRIGSGTAAAVVTDLTVETDGSAGILARGDGAVEVRRVAVRATRGIAVGVEGFRSASLEDVRLDGPVTAANAASWPADVTSADTATHGLVAVRVADLSLVRFETHGFAGFGGLAVDAATDWRGGSASANLGVGLMLHGGSGTLEDVEVCGTFQGVRLVPAYGLVFAGGADVSTARLEVCEGEGYGMLHDDVGAMHVDLSAHDNGDAAIWIQRCPWFELSGADTLLERNRFAGVVVRESGNVIVRNATIDASALAIRTFAETGSVRVGDGVQVVRPTGIVSLESVSLANNERVGVLLDVTSEQMADVNFDAVTVSGMGTQYGVVAQGDAYADGWDDGVTREGTTGVNDAAFSTPLGIAGSLAAGDMPAASVVEADGLAGIIGDCG
jgi:hypothetical protein